MVEKWVRAAGKSNRPGEWPVYCLRTCFVGQGMDYGNEHKYVVQCDCNDKSLMVDIDASFIAKLECPKVCEGKENWKSMRWQSFSSCKCKNEWPHKFGVDKPESLRFWLEGNLSEPKTNQNTKWHTTQDNKLVWLDSDQKAWCLVPSGKKFRDTEKEFYFKLDECFAENVITVQR